MSVKTNKKSVIMWQFALISGLPHFYGKMDIYVVTYRSKDKNTIVELVGSPVAPIWCK